MIVIEEIFLHLKQTNKDMKNTIIVNVDTQNDFMNVDGKLYVDNAEDIKGNLRGFFNRVRSLRMPIVHTSDFHYNDSPELSDTPDPSKGTFPPHCMAFTEGVELIDEVRPDAFDFISRWDKEDSNIDTFKEITSDKKNFEILIYKDLFDVFSGNKHTVQYLNHLRDGLGIDTAIVVGVAKNVCVNFTVMGLLQNGFRVIVVNDCCSDLVSLPSCDAYWVESYPNKCKLVDSFDDIYAEVYG